MVVVFLPYSEKKWPKLHKLLSYSDERCLVGTGWFLFRRQVPEFLLY